MHIYILNVAQDLLLNTLITFTLEQKYTSEFTKYIFFFNILEDVYSFYMVKCSFPLLKVYSLTTSSTQGVYCLLAISFKNALARS